MSEYELTEDDINLNIWISTGASAASLVLCLAVLVASAWVWRKPELRPYINRVSFRLLLWSMVFEVAYDVVYIAVELYSYYEIVGPLCAGGVYFMMAFVAVVNYLCTCIALNLMLTITFGMNPIKQGLEKWYVGVSIALGMFVPIIPAALGHFGFDPILQVCWITGRTDEQRMRYFILDLYLWQILSCALATGAVVTTLVTLFRQRRATSAALFAGNKLNRTVLSRSSHDPNDDDGDVEKGKSRKCPNYLWTRITGGPTSSRPERMVHTMSQLEDRFLKIALKISCYPVALIVVNGIITIGDLYISKEGGVYTKPMYALYCVYYFLYGGRGIVFAFLAFFIDPCLRIGLKAAWRQRFSPSRPLPGIDLESTVLDTDEKSFSEMLAMPSPVLDGGSSRVGLIKDDTRAGLGVDSRKKSLPAALRISSRGLFRSSAVGGDSGRDSEKAVEAQDGRVSFESGSVASTSEKIKLESASMKGEEEDELGNENKNENDNDDETSLGPYNTPTRMKRLSSVSLDMPSALSRLAFEQNLPTHPPASPPALPAYTNSSPNHSSLVDRIRSPRAFSRSFRHPSTSSIGAGSPRPASPSGANGANGASAPRLSLSSGRPLSPAPVPTRSFAGVDKDSLPVEMTDELDIVRPMSALRGTDSQSPTRETRGILRSGNSPTESGHERLRSVQVEATRSDDMRRPSVPLDPLAPDLPDALEHERLKRRAWREQKRLEKEEAIRAFLETKAML